jgi:hypothetical protein
MKYGIIICLAVLLSGFSSSAQEAMYSLNENNHTSFIPILKKRNYVIANVDHLFEHYNKNQFINSTQASFVHSLHNFQYGVQFENDMYNKVFNKQKAKIIAGVPFYIDKDIQIGIGLNLDIINYNIRGFSIAKRYSEEIYTAYNSNINTSVFAGGLNIFAGLYEFSAGYSINNVNQPLLPDKDQTKLPIKQTAYIRYNTKIHPVGYRIIFKLLYQYQDEHFNNVFGDHLFGVTNYMGGTIDFTNYMILISLGYRHMMEQNKNMYTAAMGINFGALFGLSYSLSIIPGFSSDINNILMHQISLHYQWGAEFFTGGSIRYL